MSPIRDHHKERHRSEGLPVGDGDGVVVAVEAMDERLNGGLVQVAQVAGRLARLLPQHHHLRVDQPAQKTQTPVLSALLACCSACALDTHSSTSRFTCYIEELFQLVYIYCILDSVFQRTCLKMKPF